MKLNVKIAESIIKKLENSNDVCYGKLYGISSKNDFIVNVLQKDIKNGFDCDTSLPVKLEYCGNFKVGNDNLLENVEVIPQSVLLTHTIGKADGVSLYIESNGKYVTSDYQVITEQEINTTFLYLRVQGEIPLQSELSKSAVTDAFQTIHKDISSKAVFNFKKSSVFLLENNMSGIDSDISLIELCEDLNSSNYEGNKKKNKSLEVKPRILDFNFMQQLTKVKTAESVKDHAPIVVLKKYTLTVIDTILKLDYIAMVPQETKAHQLFDILLESIRRTLRLFERNILNFVESKELTKSLVYQVYHYYPENCKHFLTVMYDKNQPENDLKAERLRLHEQLLLDSSMPCFRKANQYVFDKKLNGPLINPHQGVKNTDNGGIIALVKGKYEYYHYGQNKMDDNGWGCAYRSLQTLASWFKLQGYVDREVPTFKEIQQCLVDIKDKPSNFVGSRQWIGSTEVNFVLNSLLGIENKILYVTSGEEIASNGPELVNHFRNHGSPIMIGGGVLAHTILGVDYNQQTGNIKFLILDPHYTGGEELDVIQKKGWCGWKNVDFWNKTSYYNMCLPLVSREV